MNKMKLGDILKIKHGYAFKGENFSDEGKFILLTPANFYESGGFKYTPGKEKYYVGEFPQEYICKKGDLIVAMTQQAEGLLGSTAIVPEDNIYLHNQRIGLITVDETKADKKFVDYLFRTKNVRFQIEGSSSGTKVKHTSPDKIYDVDVWLPDLDNQRKIGEILSTIDETIRKNNNINQELDEIAQAIYQYWFVQYEFPNEEGNSYKSSGGEMVWNDELKRDIPQGWEVSSFCESSITKFSKYKVSEFKGEKIYLATADVEGTEIKNHSEKIYFEKRPSRANAQPMPNTIWLAKMKNSKKNILIPDYANELVENYIFSTGFTGVECFKESIYYIWNFINNNNFEVKKDSLAHGATQQAVNEDDLRQIKIPIPPFAILRRYYSKVNDIYKQIYTNNIQNQELIKLRDFILPILMNGQAKLN